MNAIQKNIVRQIMALCGTLLGEKKTPSGVPEVYAQLEAFVKAEIAKAGLDPNLSILSVVDGIESGVRKADIKLKYDSKYLIHCYFNDSLEEAVKIVKEYFSNDRLAFDIKYYKLKEQQTQLETAQTEQGNESNL